MSSQKDSQSLSTPKTFPASQPPSIDLETPLLDIFLIKLKKYFESNRNETIVSLQEFQAVWGHFKSEIKSQMKRMSAVFEKENYKNEELEVLTQKIQEKTKLPVIFKNLSPKEELPNLMKRGVTNENSWWVEKRIGLLSGVEWNKLDRFLAISGDLEEIGFKRKRNSLFSPFLDEAQKEKPLKNETNFLKEPSLLKKIKLTGPLEKNLFPKSENINNNTQIQRIQWVKFQKYLFCKVFRCNNDIYYEYAPLALLNFDLPVLEGSITEHGPIKLTKKESINLKNEKGKRLEEYIEDIRKKYKFNIQKVNIILLSLLGRAANVLGKTLLGEEKVKIQKKHCGFLRSCVKKAMFGKGIIKLEDEGGENA